MTNLYHKINEECTCLNIRKLSRMITKFFDKKMKETSITANQFSILIEVKKSGRLSLTDMANELMADRTTLSRNYELLIERGLLEKIAHGKRFLYDVTPKAEDVLKKCIPLWTKAQSEINENYIYKKLLREMIK